MNIEQVIAWLKEHEADQTMLDYLAGLKLLTPQGVKEWLDTDDGKRLIQPMLDSYHSKCLESWKTNNLDKMVEELHNKKHPPEDDRDKQIRELNERLDRADREKARAERRTIALQKMSEKKLPVELVDRFIGDDEPTTNALIEEFEKIYTSTVNELVTAEVEKRFKEHGRGPRGDDKPEKEEEEASWFREGKTWNLTKQAQLKRSDPEKYAKLKAEAERNKK
jgi:exonuclease VII large subunit